MSSNDDYRVKFVHFLQYQGTLELNAVEGTLLKLLQPSSLTGQPYFPLHELELLMDGRKIGWHTHETMITDIIGRLEGGPNTLKYLDPPGPYTTRVQLRTLWQDL